MCLKGVCVLFVCSVQCVWCLCIAYGICGVYVVSTSGVEFLWYLCEVCNMCGTCVLCIGSVCM